MPVGEKERLAKLEKARQYQAEGEVLTVPYDVAEQLVHEEPLEQLPGEGDTWYRHFLDWVSGETLTIAAWHRKNRASTHIMTTHQTARMFLWMKRRARFARQRLEVMEIASKHALYETHVSSMKITQEFSKRLLLAGLTEGDSRKAAALIRGGTELHAQTLRNHEANQKHWGRFDSEMAKLKAAETEKDEDLD